MTASRINLFLLIFSVLGSAYLFNTAGCDLYVSRPNPTSLSSNPVEVLHDPVQVAENLPPPLSFTTHKIQYEVTPVAQYEISGRVVSTKRYYMDDASFLAPVDLAIVWGDLADPTQDQWIHYDHGNRFFHYSYKPDFKIPLPYIIRHSSNNHIIAANKNIERVIKSIHEEEKVSISGFLVNVTRSDGNWKWMTSLTREDTGGGACELIYATRVQIGDEIFQ